MEQLIGRELQINHIRDFVNGTPGALALLGAAGCGKTALAVGIVRELDRIASHIVLAYTADSHADENYPWRRSLNWISLGSLLEALESDVIGLLGGQDTQVGSGDRVVHALAKVAGGGRKAVLLIDAIDHLTQDEVATRRLIGICRKLPHGCHILITARRSFVFSYPDLVPVVERLEVPGLSFDSFRELISAHHIAASDDQLPKLHRELSGMPGAVIALRTFGPVDTRSAYDSMLFTVEQALVENFTRQIENLSDEDRLCIMSALKLLVAVREAIPVHDLYRLLSSFRLRQFPLTPRALWSKLASYGVLDLCASEDIADMRLRRVKLRTGALRDVLLSDTFLGVDLTDIHRFLADHMDFQYAFDRRNKLFHALEGFGHDREKLSLFAGSVSWHQLLEQTLGEDWSEEDNLLLLDITKLLAELPPSARVATARKLTQLRANIREMSTMDRLRLDELMRTATSSMHRSRAKPLLIALDVWPGYFPIFAMEEELRKCGIEFLISHSSRMKYDFLFNRHVDLIGSTPGCLSTLPEQKLTRCHILGVLNRSLGNDQILADRRAFDLKDGVLTAASLTSQVHSALVVNGSTGHLFLLWFLRQLGVKPSQLKIEYASEYVSLRKRAIDSDSIHLISTWEPFASLSIHGRPGLVPVYTSSELPSVVFDILVADRERSDTLDCDPRLEQLWQKYDLCLKENLLGTSRVVEALVKKYRLDKRKFASWVSRMEFYGPKKRADFFAANTPDSLASVLNDIADTWATADDLMGAKEFQSWKRQLSELAGSKPHWIVHTSPPQVDHEDETSSTGLQIGLGAESLDWHQHAGRLSYHSATIATRDFRAVPMKGNSMDPQMLMTLIASGLKLVDQFRDLALKMKGNKHSPPSAVARQVESALEVPNTSGPPLRIECSQLRLTEWKAVRLDALDSRIKTLWELYNYLYSEEAGASIQEKARIHSDMKRRQAELCKDFKELVFLSEEALGTSLPEHYHLHDVCAE